MVRLLFVIFLATTTGVAQDFGHVQKPIAYPYQLSTTPEEACEALATSYEAKDVRVRSAQYFHAGSNIDLDVPWNLPDCNNPPEVAPVDMCRLILHAATSSISEIPVEVWLPTNWTGRYMSTGNGDGCIYYKQMAWTTGFGFATASALPGYNGSTMEGLFKNPERLIDFSWRSTHVGAVIGKDVVQHYYGMPHTKSYYFGCSFGGRQAFREAIGFPEDFDGIISGAPALDHNNLASYSGKFYLLTGDIGSETYLSAEDWALVHDDVLRQCDALDGVADSILEEPDLCLYRPEELLCETEKKADCLTVPQVNTVRGSFSPLYGQDGKIIFPRHSPGTELLGVNYYYTGKPNYYTDTWFKWVVYEDPSWDASKFDLAQMAYGQALDPADVSTYNGDLSAYMKRGGKLLHYHGLEDHVVTHTLSVQFYDHVARSMNMTSSKLDDFYRFFRISGMEHCSGGNGAFRIGQAGDAKIDAVQTPQNNIILRIVDWVENGNAPETLTGSRYINDNVENGVDLVRHHCKYPTRNFCIDPANYKKAEAWRCI